VERELGLKVLAAEPDLHVAENQGVDLGLRELLLLRHRKVAG